MQVDELKRELSKALEEKKGRQIEGTYSEARVEGLRKELDILKDEINRLHDKRIDLNKDIDKSQKLALEQISRDRTAAREDAAEARRLRNELESSVGNIKANQNKLEMSLEKSDLTKESLRRNVAKLREVLKDIDL